ncbi:MAG: sirohydrochlorin cobaltochelatase [Oscillospiraceae bacterium]|nr:sirohydrochlorin cobaltochelatase [Oscillospiraceae bacterium]
MAKKKPFSCLLSLLLLGSLLTACGGQPVPTPDAEVSAETDAASDNPRNQDGIGERELLVVSFGTSYNETRRLSIGAIESALETAFPDWSVRRAFTSGMILKRLKERDGISMDNVSKALDRAAANGVKTLVVQPTHLMNGFEYQELADALASRADAFEAVSIGAPLLTSDDDFRRVAEAVADATAEYDDGETAIVLMGHGTEADSNGVYEKMQGVFTEAGKAHYYVGTVEATPSLEDVLSAVRAGNYKNVVLLPLMIVAGDHATNDMAGDDDDSWKSVFESAGYEVTPILRGLGELDAIQALFAAHAQAAISGASNTDASPVGTRYAERFSMEDDGAGRVLVTIDGTERFLIVRDGAEVPDAPDGATVLQLPLDGIYVAASSAMDFFRALNALDAVRFTSTAASDWTLDAVRDAMDAGNILYAGKYSAPDFEALLSERCPLAIESTMIYHSPDIREQLESLGVSVLVERSSYETNPLGRLEWIKLYGLLTGHEAEAAAFFDEQAQAVEAICAQENTGKTAAFFSVSPNGYVSVRKPGDYVSETIEMAGGNYVFADSLSDADNSRYTVNLQMEAFYAAARDADFLIYDGAIESDLETLQQLLEKNELFADFKAVKSGDVWRSAPNMFQEPTAAGGVIADFHAAFTGVTDDLTYLRRLS